MLLATKKRTISTSPKLALELSSTKWVRTVTRTIRSKSHKTDVMNEFMENCCSGCGTSIAVMNGKGIWMGHRRSKYPTPIDQCLRGDEVMSARERKRRELFGNWFEAADSNKINSIPLPDVDELVNTYRTQNDLWRRTCESSAPN